ncbi:MAG TPA: universal stress protein [Planococcus sp. (in: firmicutes)]|nr:universal stress protein [Planococcus sp. (in: firmicutes)]
METKLLLASDGSDHALRATAEAVKLAKLNRSEVVILYVLNSDRDMDDSGKVNPDVENQLTATKQVLQKSDVAHSVEFLHGEPGSAIAKYANSHECGYLVVGSRGLNAMQEMVLGSVSYKLMKSVECPVLIVK